MTPATARTTMPPMLETKESLRLKNLFLELARGFTSDHKNLTVEHAQSGQMITLSPRASNDDVGKLVGTGGAVFTALRDVLLVAARKNGFEFYLARVKAARGTVAGEMKRFKASKVWPQEELLDAFKLLCGELFTRDWVAGYRHEADESVLVVHLSDEEKIATCCGSEQKPMADSQLADAMTIVMRVLGTCRGRLLSVEIERS